MPKIVLIVEDEPTLRETFAEIVELEGHEILTAANGAVALDLLRSGPRPDLILLDIMMPVKDGFAFRTEQLGDPSLAAIPVIVLTAFTDLGPRASLFGKEVEVIRKPPTLERLLKVIRTKLAQPGS